MKRRMARVLAMVMAVVLMGTSTNVTAFAARICDHHLEHTAGCGYVEAVEGADCTHEHDDECYSEVEVCVHKHDENCGYAEGFCTHVCSEESGCIKTKENCNHTHDESCGYKAAVEGSPCIFACDECSSEESGQEDEEENDTCICEDKCTADAVNEECPVCSLEEADLALCAGEAVEEEEETDTCICENKCTADAVNEECPVCSLEEADLTLCAGEETAVCTCGTDDPAFHATNCLAYIAPKNPQCICVEKCTEDTLNVWCDVCGIQGVSACQGTDTAATYAEPPVFSDAKVLTAVDGALCIDGETLTINTNQYGSTSVIMPAGNYKLESDITTNIHVYTEDSINIDLNGHTWNMSNKNLRIDNNVTLSLYDTSDEGTGKITSSYEMTVYVVGSETTFNLYNGTVENTSNVVNARGVSSEYGSSNLYGGTIKSNAYAVFYNLHKDITINIDNTSFDCGNGHAQITATLSPYGEPCAVIDVSDYEGGALTVDAKIDKAGKIKIFTGIQPARDAENYKVNVRFDANDDFFKEKEEYEEDGGNKYVYVSVPSFTTQPTEGNLYTVAFNYPNAALQWCEVTVYDSATYSQAYGEHSKSYEVNAGDTLIVSLSECSDDFRVDFGCSYNEESLYMSLDSSRKNASVTFDSACSVNVNVMLSPYGTGEYKIERVRCTELNGETDVHLSKTECETTYVCKATVGEREYYSDEVKIEQEHSYTCTPTSDNVITKECTNCGKSGTLTIEAEDGVYDGRTAYGATVIKTGILENEDVTVNYYQGNTLIGTDAPINAGTYTAKITYEEVTASVTFTITITRAFEVTGGTEGVDYTYENGVLTINTSTALTIKNTDPSTSTTDRIEVADGVSANITLAGVNIDVSSQSNTAAFKIADNSAGNVTITLADGTTNTLKSGRYCAGLQKNGVYISETQGKLTITGTGSLTATGGDYGAGIGGGDDCDGSNITISGGTVEAQGGDDGAGIGGGRADSGSNIKISGGTVEAQGGDGGAGIGGGYAGSGSNIKISGGTVTATGGERGAGIGGGDDCDGSNITNITISGGSVKADTIGCTPTDGTANATPVYLLEFDVDGTSAVTINGKAYPTKHIDENTLYVYLPAGIYTVANGNSQKIYTIADNGDVSEVVVGTAFTITGTDLVYSTDYTYPASTGVLTILSDKDIAIKNANPSTPTTDRIEVADGVSANITLAGVNIDVSSQSNTAAFKIADNSAGNVTITLADGTTNTLKSGVYCAGLQKNGAYISETQGKLTITGTGTLTATGGDYGAGIGGGRSGSGSNIEISGGTVTATCGEGGAGIGGGWSGSGSDIKISGGTVTATGGEYGAGIGGGKSGSGSNIEISGGTVEAQGSDGGAGIGGAGIGGGSSGSGSYITISGGKVTATGGERGAGIGGGDSYGQAVGCNIKISGGTVTATGGEKGAGIGGGYAGSGSNIEISGGTVTATGGESGAGIGGGYNRSADNIKISGGEVTATGGKGGAGIGGGYPRGSADNIKISGGSVKAVAGEKYKYDGTTYFPAAIGQSVQYNDSTSVYSDGAEVTPTDGNGNNVYLLELDVDGTSAVTINGKAYPTKHFDENKVYIYLPAKTAQAPNEVTVGNETTKYCYINAKWLKVVDSPEADDYTEFTYDGKEKTYTLAESDYYTITGNKQTNAGTYTVTVALNDKDNTVWNDGTTEDKEYSFVIYKADSVLETVPTPKTGLIYKGEGQNLISAGTATGGTMQYSLNCVSWSPDIPSATDAGEYTVYYKIAGNENYNGSEADSFTVNIAKKQLTVTEVAATSRDYIANDKTVDITGITLSGIQGTDDVSVKITGLKGTLSSANADTYTSVTLPTLTLINDDRGNYELVQPTSAVATNVTINKLNPTITLTVQTSITKTYGDEIFDLGATEDSPEAGLQYEVTGGADVVSVSSTGKVTILKAGVATITVTVPASTNYNSVSKEIIVTVEKAENAPNIPGNAMNVSNSYTKIGDVPLPTGWEWQDADKEFSLPVDSPVTAKAVYTGADKGNYKNESVEIVVTRANHDHVESEVLYDTNAGEHAPTCTEDGLGHVECTIEGCDKTLRTNVVVDALGHNYVSKVTKQPTTTEEGIMTYTCSNCGDSYTKPISKLPSSGGGSDDDSGDDETSGSSGSSSDGGSTNDTPATETPTPQTPTGGTTAPTTPQPGGNIPVAEPGEETDNPGPFIKGDDGKEGWDVISGEVEDAEEGDTVTVNMNGTTVVPGDVLNDIKGKDITMVFDLGNGVAWSVNGKDITSDNVGDIDFEVKVGADANDSIPVEVRNVVTGESNFVNISLAYDGEFGFEAVLSVNLEKENAGLYANLFYYNPQTNEMEFICSDVIAEDGTAELIFTHASEYTIVIDEAAMDAPASSEEGILPEIGVEAEEDNSSDATNVSDPLEFGSDDNNSAWWIILLIALLAVAGVAGFVVYSKKKKSE